MLIKNLLIIPLLFLTFSLNAWEEDPRIEEHNKRTDYLMKLGNRQVKEKNEDVIRLLTFIHQERQKLNEKKDE